MASPLRWLCSISMETGFFPPGSERARARGAASPLYSRERGGEGDGEREREREKERETERVRERWRRRGRRRRREREGKKSGIQGQMYIPWRVPRNTAKHSGY